MSSSPGPPGLPSLPWRNLVLWSVLGLALGLGLLLYNYQRSESLGTFVVTRPSDVSAELIGRELGPTAVNAGGEHDGHYFYLIARAPMHFDASVPYLDRPGYRLGRPVAPWLAWALHPSGGGWGLLWAMFAVGVASLFVGAMGMGALSVTLRGPPWPALVFPVALGSVLSMRISVPDPLAVAFAIWAVVLLYRKHLLGALIVGALAVLTKESVLLIFAGVLVARRDRDSALLVGAPVAAILAWQVWMRIAIGDVGKPVDEIGLPFGGFKDSISWWADGNEPLGLLAILSAAMLAVFAFSLRGLKHPLSWMLVIQVAFVVVLKVSVLAPERNAARAVLPMTVIAAVMLATPKAKSALAASSRSADASTSAATAP